MHQDQETLGQYLKRERESHRVPVEEMALFLGVDRSFIEALEGDDFDPFSRRSECLRLVKRHTSFLKLNPEEALRLFDAQWKLTGGVKRYPKLTQFAEGDVTPARSALFKGKRRLAGHFPGRQVWLSVAAVALIALSVLAIDLVDTKWEMTPTGYLPSSEPEATVPPPVPGRVSLPAADRERRIAATKKASLPEAPQAPNLPSVRDRVSLAEADAAGRTEPPRQAVRPEAPHPRPAFAGREIAPQPRGARVIGNRDSKRYHLPGMKYYDLVKEYHRVVFPSEKEAIRAGYRKARE